MKTICLNYFSFWLSIKYETEVCTELNEALGNFQRIINVMSKRLLHPEYHVDV